MKDAIRQRALGLGFDDCRFTSAQPPDHAAQFHKWVEEKQFGEMQWLERNAEKRMELQLVLEGAKSVICLAVSYSSNGDLCGKVGTPPHPFPLPRWGRGDGEARSPENFNEPDVTRQEINRKNSGMVARYARFEDYHDVIAERLKTLTEFVNQQGGRSLWYVDTGPIMERDLAQRAGMGFVGKHTNLISRKLGNWIFLAEIITTLDLEPDVLEKNRCGSCARCIEACPTAAITAPFQLDARRCISYLTIELKGAIPVEFRRAIGDRIYGCDDCLAACPWNRFAREGQLMKSHARADLAAPDLVELLSLDDAAFKKRFADSPILRTKRRGFLRNVCVALGNVGDESTLPALETAMRDSEPLIVEHAKWAIGEIESRTRRDY